MQCQTFDLEPIVFGVVKFIIYIVESSVDSAIFLCTLYHFMFMMLVM